MIRAYAPGRVNLIGEHTDYNDGFVMPVAIALGTAATAAPRDDRRVAIRSGAFSGTAGFDLDDLREERRGDWSDYARGVLIELRRAGVPLRGATVELSSTLPIGAGLSSSASLEIALALALLRAAGAPLERAELAQLARRAETTGAGVRSGIMDQFAVLFGRRGCATLLDTRSLQVSHLPLPAGTTVAIANTMVERRLASGEYNRRREECERAVAMLSAAIPRIASLRDATLGDLDACRTELGDVLYRRARHVVTENARVLGAARALEAGDPAAFGALANASHASLRDDYEVSCPELDALAAAARACDGVYGARMTGAGFGGCIVALLEAGRVEAFRATVAQRYRDQTGIEPAFYDGTPADGASADG